jgi:hypothetical protein
MLAPAATIRTLDLSSRAERDRHDAFVRERPEGTPFHLSAWGRAIAKGTGQRPRYLVAESNR